MSSFYTREMTITHKEFLRLLPKAISGLEYEKNGNHILIEDGESALSIKLSKESTRKIASLSLPTTSVEITLSGYSEAESLKFMSRFDLSYQKGGG